MTDKPVIGHCHCPECGSRNEMRLNKNNIAYYYCGNCCHHERYSREASRKMKEQSESKPNAEFSTNSDAGSEQPAKPSISGERPAPNYAEESFL